MTTTLELIRVQLLALVCGGFMAVSTGKAVAATPDEPVPSPRKVLHKIGGFFHRLFDGDKVDREQDRGRASPRRNEDVATKIAVTSTRSTNSAANSGSETSAPRAGAPDPQSRRKATSSVATNTRRTPAPINPGAHGDEAHSVKSQDRPPQKPVGVTEKESAPNASIDASVTVEPSLKAAPLAPSQPSTTPHDPKVEFARPVLGKRGFVYPPCTEESVESIVDVTDFEPGQIVRDPRTKALFRVP